ncbi:hypothetical protein FDZ71_05330 [bacterium]|nr:MAG: hypothetical protein FDZ71_05330 [bacterium]
MKPSGAFCAACKMPLGQGDLKFLVTINVMADFDGSLPANGRIEDLESFMRSIDKEDSKQLERDVYQSLGYILCPECKRKFLENPLGLRPDEEGAADGKVH